MKKNEVQVGGVYTAKVSDKLVEVRIDGAIARVKLTQRYGNSGTAPIEAVYVFPASTRAARPSPA